MINNWHVIDKAPDVITKAPIPLDSDKKARIGNSAGHLESIANDPWILQQPLNISLIKGRNFVHIKLAKALR